MRPAFFVVVRANGMEHPAIYWDELPQHRLREVVYVMRLDTLPNAEEVLKHSVTDLFTQYKLMAKRGKLPPKYDPKVEPPKREQGGG